MPISRAKVIPLFIMFICLFDVVAAKKKSKPFPFPVVIIGSLLGIIYAVVFLGLVIFFIYKWIRWQTEQEMVYQCRLVELNHREAIIQRASVVHDAYKQQEVELVEAQQQKNRERALEQEKEVAEYEKARRKRKARQKASSIPPEDLVQRAGVSYVERPKTTRSMMNKRVVDPSVTYGAPIRQADFSMLQSRNVSVSRMGDRSLSLAPVPSECVVNKPAYASRVPPKNILLQSEGKQQSSASDTGNASMQLG